MTDTNYTLVDYMSHHAPNRSMPGNALLRFPELTQEQVALVEWMVSTPDGRRFLADVVADARLAVRTA